MACTASSLIATAMAAGYGALSHRALLETIVVSACAASGAGGGGQINSGNGVPVANPGVANAFYTDKLTGILYAWYDGAWH